MSTTTENQVNGVHMGVPTDSTHTAAADGDADAFRFGRPPDNLPQLTPAPDSREAPSSDIKVVEIDLNSRRQRSQFLDMADAFYEGDPNYISPLRLQFMEFLNPSKNPAFKNLDYQAFFALENGTPKARIVAHIDKAYNRYHGTPTGFFGFFESADDPKVAHTLLNHAAQWLKDRGAKEVFGPLNFSTNHQVGLLVENFTRPPTVEGTYNPPYYETLFQSFGFGKAKDLLMWKIDPSQGMDTPRRQRIQRVASRVMKREGVTIRPVRFKEASAEIERIYQIYTRSWERNWGFVPPSREEFQFLMKDLKTIARPELVLIVESQGEPVAFSASLPNVNEKLPKSGRLFPFNWLKMLTIKQTSSGRLITLGVIPKYRKRGLETLMFTETLNTAQKLGWTEGEIGWTLEDNDLVNRAIESMDGHVDRRYRILGLNLE